MRLVLLLAGALALLGGPALAEKRLALVIGNGAYGNLGPLDNPSADARLMSRSLEGVGFEVTTLIDVGEDRMKRGVLDFGRRLRGAGSDAVGLFYFAGHGIQAEGRNFLLPVGVDVRDAADLYVEALDANWVLAQLESAGNATNIVVLDACRNNPFQRSFRSASRGLARMNAPRGSFVAYATEPGGVAADGDGANSPYTAALARAVLTPGLAIEQVFKQVRVDVLGKTDGRQIPWDSSSLTGDFYFVPDGGGVLTPLPPAGSAEEVAFWNRARQSGDPILLRTFLDIYPNSTYADEARALLSQGTLANVAPSAPAPQPSAGQPSASRSGRVRLKISTDWSRINPPSCGLPGDLGVVDVALGGDPVVVAARGGALALTYRVAARADGGGALVTVSPKLGYDRWEPIDIQLDSLAPGPEVLEYSRVKVPDRPNCGRINVYVKVVE